MKRLLLGLVALMPLALASLGSLGATSAARAPEAPWVTAAGSPLIDLTTLAPGGAGSSTFEVHNPRNQPVRMSVRVVDLASDDNGCNHPEALAGDTTCGVGEGEVQHDLVLRIRAIDGESNRAIGEGVLATIEDEWFADDAVLDVGGSRSYAVDYRLPGSSSNVTQTDQVGFDLEIALDTATAVRAQVMAAGATRGDLTTISGSELASTGPPLPLAGVGSALIAGGVLTSVAVRRRRHLPLPN